MLGWLAPNHYYPWTSFYSDLCAFLGLLVLSLGLFSANIRQRIRGPASAIFIFGLAFIAWLQWAGGLVYFLSDAIMVSLYLLGMALAILVGRNFEDTAKFADWLASILFAGSVISVGLALAQWLRVDVFGIWLIEMPPNGRPYANLAQPNNFAMLLCLGIGATVYLRERGYIGRPVESLVVTFLFAGIAVSRSRMALIVIVLIALWMVHGSRRGLISCELRRILLGGLVGISMWLLWPLLADALLLASDSSAQRLAGVFDNEARWVIWQQLIDAAFRSPWVGYGWNQISVAQLATAAEYPQSGFTEHAHNLLVDLLCWNGVFLGGAIILTGAVWLARRLAAVRQTEAWFALIVILALLTHAMLEYPLDYAYFLLPFGLAVGIVERSSSQEGRLLPGAALAVVGIAGIGMLVWIFVEYQTVEEDFRHLGYESVGIEATPPSDRIAPDVVLLTGNREFLRFARSRAAEGMSGEALEKMRKVVFRFAYPPALFRYALALGLNGRYEEASLQLLRLRQLHPKARFAEAVDNWRTLEETYPALKNVQLPAK